MALLRDWLFCDAPEALSSGLILLPRLETSKDGFTVLNKPFDVLKYINLAHQAIHQTGYRYKIAHIVCSWNVSGIMTSTQSEL